ncbi:tautomerase family protein [Methylobacterium sp. A54F]
MPHVIVKLYAGRTEAQKADLAEAVARAVIASAGCSEASVSVAVEDVAPDDWRASVYEPDILGRPDSLYRKPGYDPR